LKLKQSLIAIVNIFITPIAILFVVLDLEAAEIEPRVEITEPPIVKTQRIIRLLYWLMPLIIFATIGLAWWQYPETFSFQKSFISQLGTYTSQSGFDNSISSLIMTIGFGLCATLTLIIATIYFLKMSLESSFIKGLLNSSYNEG
jgi:hypothetical protein